MALHPLNCCKTWPCDWIYELCVCAEEVDGGEVFFWAWNVGLNFEDTSTISFRLSDNVWSASSSNHELGFGPVVTALSPINSIDVFHRAEVVGRNAQDVVNRRGKPHFS